MKKRRKSYKDVDNQLTKVLETMIEEGVVLSPISLSTVAKRLGLKSRSTLLLDHRAIMVKNAKLKQLEIAGVKENGEKKRKSLKSQLEEHKIKIQDLQAENEILLLRITEILYNLNAKGLDVDELMRPLRF